MGNGLALLISFLAWRDTALGMGTAWMGGLIIALGSWLPKIVCCLHWVIPVGERGSTYNATPPLGDIFRHYDTIISLTYII